jgi:hypothetical protein
MRTSSFQGEASAAPDYPEHTRIAIRFAGFLN